MKNIINKKFVFGLIVGLMFSVMTVYATTIYSASQIKYNNITVEEALNNLNNDKKCINRTIEHSTNTQYNIELGFVPSSFSIYIKLATGQYRFLIYNNNVDSNVYCTVINPTGTTIYAETQTTTFNIGTSITTTFPTTYLLYSNMYTIYFTACK